MPVWCFFHLSNFWLISQLHYVDACFRSGTQHSSLCANGLSASLRLRVQLRGDSLISHLAVLFLNCRVIMPEVDGRVRNGLYLKEDTSELFWKSRLLLLFAPCWFLLQLLHLTVKFITWSQRDFIIGLCTWLKVFTVIMAEVNFLFFRVCAKPHWRGIKLVLHMQPELGH